MRDDQHQPCSRVRRWGWLLVLALPSVALAQAGLGTGGTTSGNYTGGVSDSQMPRDPTQVGRVQVTRTPPLFGEDGAAELRDATDPDARRTRGMIRPEEGTHARRLERVWK
jgi:hypothetical protein